jgi:hypothetical protein
VTGSGGLASQLPGRARRGRTLESGGRSGNRDR